ANETPAFGLSFVVNCSRLRLQSDGSPSERQLRAPFLPMGSRVRACFIKLQRLNDRKLRRSQSAATEAAYKSEIATVPYDRRVPNCRFDRLQSRTVQQKRQRLKPLPLR